MANSELSGRTEHSVLCALQDLKTIEADRVAEEARLAAEAARRQAEAERAAAERIEQLRIADETRRIEALRAEAALVAAQAEAAQAETARAKQARRADAHAEERLADDQRALRRLLGNPEPLPPSRSWLWPATLALVALALGGTGIAWSLRPPTVVVTELVPAPPPTLPTPTVTPPPVAAPAPPPPMAIKPKRVRRDKPIAAAKPSAATSILRGMELCGDDPTCSIR